MAIVKRLETLTCVWFLKMFLPGFCLLLATGRSVYSGGDLLTLTKEDDGKTIEVLVNSEFRVELLGIPTTGFLWHITALDQGYLTVLGEERKVRDEGERKAGTPALTIFRLKAKKAGKTTLKLAYYRPWEGGEKAAGRFQVTLEIKSN